MFTGDALKDEWPLDAFDGGNYYLRVYSPNGFFGKFIGNNNDPNIQIACGYQISRLSKKSLTGNIELKITNLSPAKTIDVKLSQTVLTKSNQYLKR